VRTIAFAALIGLAVTWAGSGAHAQSATAAKLPKVPHVAEYGSAKDKKDVNDTMDMMLKAYKAKDMATLDKLLHKDLVYGHTSGETQDKAKVMAVAKERDTVDTVLTDRMTYVSSQVAFVRGIGNLTLKGEEAGAGRGSRLVPGARRERAAWMADYRPAELAARQPATVTGNTSACRRGHGRYSVPTGRALFVITTEVAREDLEMDDMCVGSPGSCHDHDLGCGGEGRQLRDRPVRGG
jgi:hypothetical protein